MQPIESSEEFGCLGDAISSLKSVPREYIERDLRITGASDDHDNATLNYGPDASGNLYAIEHQRKLHWFSHKCRAIAWKGSTGQVAAERREKDEAALHGWLATLGIDELVPVFMEKGWYGEHRLERMKVSGLAAEDLDELGIRDERYRGVLLQGKRKAAMPQTEWTCFDKRCPRSFGSREALQQHCEDTGHQSANATKSTMEKFNEDVRRQRKQQHRSANATSARQ
eukprot:TRINITY_DN15342_c0_g1_i4.p1 TRINITY_DN15342_c0_g1~~TRINITY_DN15342_c0_g1_i4.p1  ORF type:complete len:226 (-),score=37.97 TRINITY_DN15342_c0_g1_i4:203-880(-)